MWPWFPNHGMYAARSSLEPAFPCRSTTFLDSAPHKITDITTTSHKARCIFHLKVQITKNQLLGAAVGRVLLTIGGRKSTISLPADCENAAKNARILVFLSTSECGN